jgi:hypothetical protein
MPAVDVPFATVVADRPDLAVGDGRCSGKDAAMRRIFQCCHSLRGVITYDVAYSS